MRNLVLHSGFMLAIMWGLIQQHGQTMEKDRCMAKDSTSKHGSYVEIHNKSYQLSDYHLKSGKKVAKDYFRTSGRKLKIIDGYTLLNEPEELKLSLDVYKAEATKGNLFAMRSLGHYYWDPMSFRRNISAPYAFCWDSEVAEYYLNLAAHHKSSKPVDVMCLGFFYMGMAQFFINSKPFDFNYNDAGAKISYQYYWWGFGKRLTDIGMYTVVPSDPNKEIPVKDNRGGSFLNFEASLEVYKTEADRDNFFALRALGLFYEDFENYHPQFKSFKLAAKYLRRAALHRQATWQDKHHIWYLCKYGIKNHGSDEDQQDKFLNKIVYKVLTSPVFQEIADEEAEKDGFASVNGNEKKHKEKKKITKVLPIKQKLER
jgi:TPR repeat protein